MARRHERRKVSIFTPPRTRSGGAWIRLNPTAQRAKQKYPPPRRQKLLPGWIYNR